VNIPANPEALKEKRVHDIVIKDYIRENAKEMNIDCKDILCEIENTTYTQDTTTLTTDVEIPDEEREDLPDNIKERLQRLDELKEEKEKKIKQKEYEQLEKDIDEQITNLEEEINNMEKIEELNKQLEECQLGITQLINK